MYFVTLIVIYLLAFGLGDITAKDCSEEDGCCTANYIFNKYSNSCDPCPHGRFGTKCSETCPRGYYGLFCNHKCNCDNGTSCSPTTGCLSITSTTKVEMTTNEVEVDKNKCSKPEALGCCWNYYFNEDTNRCDPCPSGTFGSNCSFPCPSGYYGHLCKRKCNCSSGMVCFPATGCLSLIVTNRSDTSIIIVNTTPFRISMILVICFSCLTVGVLCCYKLRKFDIGQVSKILHFKAPGNNNRRNLANVSISNANYTLTQSSFGETIGGTVGNHDPVEPIVGIYDNITLPASDNTYLKRQSSEYKTLQLRIRNISCNSFDFDAMENNYEEYNLRCFDNKLSEDSVDNSNLYNKCLIPAREIAISCCENDKGYKINKLEVCVHAEHENTYDNITTALQSCSGTHLLPPDTGKMDGGEQARSTI